MFYHHTYKYNLWCSLAMFISAYSDRESDCFNLITIMDLRIIMTTIDITIITNITIRPAQLAELPRSEFDPELFPHSAYDKFL